MLILLMRLLAMLIQLLIPNYGNLLIARVFHPIQDPQIVMHVSHSEFLRTFARLGPLCASGACAPCEDAIGAKVVAVRRRLQLNPKKMRPGS
jgi:hypothetical protein